jgi:ABC-type uncharacterized transport system ATPase component
MGYIVILYNSGFLKSKVMASRLHCVTKRMTNLCIFMSVGKRGGRSIDSKKEMTTKSNYVGKISSYGMDLISRLAQKVNDLDGDNKHKLFLFYSAFGSKQEVLYSASVTA